jgi:hypothetical protein
MRNSATGRAGGTVPARWKSYQRYQIAAEGKALADIRCQMHL